MIEYITKVWQDSRITQPVEMIVMHVLADNCDEEGTCWMDLKLVARICRIDHGKLCRTVTKLEKQGLIRVRSEFKSGGIGLQVRCDGEPSMQKEG